MTRNDYDQVMKSVRIADLKAHLSAHLRSVRRGETLTVLDRETPIARIVPALDHASALRIRRPLASGPRPADVPRPRALKTKRDPVALLLEDRERGR
jgi:antitoxin (DNA-binding transcriptional repressor) of toxin-antitoxin stability system